MQVFGKLLVAFPGDDGEGVEFKALLPFPLLIDAEAQAAADGLSPGRLAGNVAQGADLEYVGIVPALAQGGMGKDELQRLLQAQQPFLFPHNQLVGPLGVVPVFLIVFRRFGPAAAAIQGKVAVMDLLHRRRRQIHALKKLAVIGMAGRPAVLLLKNPGIFARSRAAVSIISPILGYRVDEKQGQHLDALGLEPLLLVQVLAEGFAQHQAGEGLAVGGPPGLAGRQPLLPAGRPQQQIFPAAAGRLDFPNPAVGVQRPPGTAFQIIAILHRQGAAVNPAGRRGHIHLDLRGDGIAPAADGKQPHIGPVVIVPGRGGGDLNLLDQLPLVGIHRIKAIDHMVFINRGRRITQGTQGVHRLQGGPALAGQAALDALRFIHNQDGMGGPHQVNGLFAAGFFVGLVDAVELPLVDGPHGDDHYLEVGAGGKVTHLAQLGGIIEEMLKGDAGIEGAEMVGHHFNRLVDALFNGDRRHHDGELGKAVLPVQLKDGAEIDIGFAGAGFHFHGEIRGFQLVGRPQAMPPLHLPQVRQQGIRGQAQPIAQAPDILRQAQTAGFLRELGQAELAAAKFLPPEQVADRRNGRLLIIQIRLKAELQRRRHIRYSGPGQCRAAAGFRSS